MANTTKGRRVTGPERDRLTKELTRAYSGGASIRQLAAETSRSYGFVHRILKDAGVELRGRGGTTRRKSPER